MADTTRSRTLRYLVTGALLVGPAVACDDPEPEVVEPTINVMQEQPEPPVVEPEPDDPEEPSGENGTEEAAVPPVGSIGEMGLMPSSNALPPRPLGESGLGMVRHQPRPSLPSMQEAPDEELQRLLDED